MGGESVYVASVVSTYWAVSISMVYLNKILMSDDAILIPTPLFVTWYQCLATVGVCWLAGLCGGRARATAPRYVPLATDAGMQGGASDPPPRPGFCAQFPRAEYVGGTALRILPLSFVFVGMIIFNNLCLKFVEVSFYNVARSLTIVFNVLLSRVFLGMPTSCKTVLCLMIVIAGFFVGSRGELNFSPIGTVFGVLSSLLVSLNSIFTKKVLPVVDDNHWRLTFYNNVNAAFLFIPLVVFFEGDIILSSRQRLTSTVFWMAMSLAGFFGFSIGIVTVLQIKATSPLSHNISGTAKAAVQSLMAFYLWGNEPTVMGVLGIFTVLGGSLLYTFVRMGENAREAPPPPPEVPPGRQQEMTSGV